MSSETAQTRRRTRLEPVTTMEEIPVLEERERVLLLGSLEQAEAELAAGKGVDFDPNTFRDRLLTIYRGDRP